MNSPNPQHTAKPRPFRPGQKQPQNQCSQRAAQPAQHRRCQRCPQGQLPPGQHQCCACHTQQGAHRPGKRGQEKQAAVQGNRPPPLYQRPGQAAAPGLSGLQHAADPAPPLHQADPEGHRLHIRVTAPGTQATG